MLESLRAGSPRMFRVMWNLASDEMISGMAVVHRRPGNVFGEAGREGIIPPDGCSGTSNTELEGTVGPGGVEVRFKIT